MRIVRERSASGVAQASRHPEVNQESSTGFEPNNQILAATLECGNAFPFELGCDGRRLERTDEPRIANVDLLQPPADEVRLECETNRLHLWQLGHLS